MKSYVISLAILVLFQATGATQYNFTPVKSLKCSAVEDQQSSNTCWSFATNSFLESEMLRLGKPSVDLSEMYLVRQIYLDKARNYILRQGKANFDEGGLAHDVIGGISRYGAVPEKVYPGRENANTPHSHAELSVVLKSVLDGMLDKKVVSDKWTEVINAILDIYLGPLQSSFSINGQTLNPQTYAQSLGINLKDYVSLTSFTHHPFYESFILELPDNFANGAFYNVPLDEFARVARHALEHGYTITWNGDVSEPGFSAQHGVAVNPVQPKREDLFSRPGPELIVTQDERQKMFEKFSTTDDHLMHIVGIARDQNGNNYYIVKNSWGEVGVHDGYLYMSEAYFNAKTIAMMIHKDGLTTELKARIVP